MQREHPSDATRSQSMRAARVTLAVPTTLAIADRRWHAVAQRSRIGRHDASFADIATQLERSMPTPQLARSISHATRLLRSHAATVSTSAKRAHRSTRLRPSSTSRIVAHADRLAANCQLASRRYLAGQRSPLDDQNTGDANHGLHTSATALSEQCAGAAHRCQDDGDPSRQASQRLRDESQRGARRQRPARAKHRRPVPQHREGAGRHSRGRPQQRRRPRQPLDVLDDHGPQGRRQAGRRLGQGDRQRARRLRQVQGSSSPRPASRASAAAGPGSASTRPASSASKARRTRTTRT